MKKYKLIKEYPGSAKLGAIYEDDRGYTINFANEPEYYEEIKKDQFKVGDWVTMDHWKVCYKVERVLADGGVLVESHPEKNYPEDVRRYGRDTNIRLATREEIKNHLTAEAKKRYLVGDKYISADNDGDDDSCTLKSLDNLSYYPETESLTDGWGGYIYYEGKWAERIEESIEIAGYRAKFHDGNVTFGCKGYSKSEVNELLRIMERFEITAINIPQAHMSIHQDFIRKIRDRIK